MNLAIFDLDNTLLAGDSDYTWGNFLVEQGIVDADHYQQANDHFYQQYQDKTLDIHEYQQFVLTPLINMSESMRNRLHQQFMDSHIAPIRQAKADALIAKHQSQGDILLVITATNRFIAQPIVKAIGIDHVLATDPEMVNGQFTGRIDGTPCFQEGKITRLQQWLTENSHYQFDSTTFYSDSINDAPLLHYVDHPIAVDPDEALTKLAQEQQWPIISLRD